ncbi:ABC transporter ATP-binding protein [Bifidobacterium psychraerophilum]|uniref:ABC transporter ATP-binding protein n=1 Tax=Bifidobacterium psychraerophilum TaxID=218140 RepID=UPI00310C9FFB
MSERSTTGRGHTVVSGESDPQQEGDSAAVLRIRNLQVDYRTRARSVHAVRDASIDVYPSQAMAIVGESGSGKSTIVHAILGILPDSTRIDGVLEVGGRDMIRSSERERREIRRSDIGFIPQDPQSSLDPTMRIGAQLGQIIALKEGLEGRQSIHARVLELLHEAGFDDPELRSRQYPHELSGGLKQRALIAAAMAGSPKIIVADEPTSALDVTVQKVILDRIEELVRRRGIALLMVTHDLAVAADRVQRIVVMHHGQVVDQGDTAAILQHSTKAYTRELVDSAPAFEFDGADRREEERGGRVSAEEKRPSDGRPSHTADHDSNAVVWNDVTKTFGSYTASRHATGVLTALSKVSIAAPAGETLAIVGESGSGKSTLLRIALGLIRPSSGTASVNGIDVVSSNRKELRLARRGFQLVQQNPYQSLDGRLTIRDVIAEPLKAFHVGNRSSRDRRVRELLDRVALPQSLLGARASELSGGQCQRVAIARALAIRPTTVFLDEPVSALDVSVQAQVIDLLIELQRDLGLSYVFVSHDLAVVALIAHNVAVLQHGEVVESGETGQVIYNPAHPYTQRLIDSIPGRRVH